MSKTYQLNHHRGCSCPPCSDLRERLPKTAPAIATIPGTANLIAAIRAVDAGLEKLAECAPVAWSRIGRLRVELHKTVSDTQILAPMPADMVAEIERLSKNQ